MALPASSHRAVTQSSLPPCLLGSITGETRARLREALLMAVRDFEFYAQRYSSSGASLADISSKDPIDILRRLPILEAGDLDELASESLSRVEGIVDMETSSGTTGSRKRRFISHEDDASETEFIAELFRVCGLHSDSRVACLDTDPLTLMVSFTKALQSLGVRESYMYSVGSDFEAMLADLPRLDPTVIITVPSIIERCFEVLESHYAAGSGPSLEKIIFVGEPLPIPMRKMLQDTFDVEVFGYYGASETSALGIECSDHHGTHIFTDHNLVEFAPDGPHFDRGELVITTLIQRAFPLIRYALKDKVALIPGRCPCDLPHPRVDVLGRTDDSVSILGAKLSYDSVLAALYKHSDETGPMQIVVSHDEDESLDIVLPSSMRQSETDLRRVLMIAQPDLDFLVSSKHLRLSFSYIEDSSFWESRKNRRVVDNRRSYESAL